MRCVQLTFNGRGRTGPAIICGGEGAWVVRTSLVDVALANHQVASADAVQLEDILENVRPNVREHQVLQLIERLRAQETAGHSAAIINGERQLLQ